MVQVSQKSSFRRKVVALLHQYNIIASGLHRQHMGFPLGWDKEIMWLGL
jgi:hypothetical protein